MPLRCSSCSWVVFSASWSPREACVGVLPLTPLVPDLPSNDLHLIPLDALWCSQDGHALKQFSCSVGAHGVNVNPSLGQPAITGSQDRHVSPLSERGQDRALSQSPWWVCFSSCSHPTGPLLALALQGPVPPLAWVGLRPVPPDFPCAHGPH